jgi:hypothetical protein
MILFGHRFIPSESFYHVANILTIEKTPPSSTIYFAFSEENLDIINYANENFVPIALGVEDITQAIYASALGAKYILVNKELAKSVQDLATAYLFDAKILVHIDGEDEIEDLAVLGVDGVIFKEAIIKVTH